MTTTTTRWGDGVNAEAIAAWDGPLFERFLRFRHLFTSGNGKHGARALELYPPQPGWRVLDLGCGFGDETLRIAGMVGDDGEAVGVDAAPRFIETAQADAAEAGADNARFFVADVETADLGEGFDMAFSRMGTMFFANPVAAMRRIRAALKPGAKLVMVVWRRREDNPWLYRGQTVVEEIVSRPEDHEEPTCGPGPFSMSGADTTSDILQYAGFGDVTLHRCDRPYLIGRDLDEAIDAVTALGPAGELLRLAGDRLDAAMRERVDRALRESYAELEGDDGGIWATASTWIVAATA